MSDDMDERYATAREHWELREDVAGLKADVRQIGPSLARIETMIAAKSAAVPQVDHWQLTAQRAMDLLERKHNGGVHNVGHSILITLALIGVGVTAFVIGKVFF